MSKAYLSENVGVLISRHSALRRDVQIVSAIHALTFIHEELKVPEDAVLSLGRPYKPNTRGSHRGQRPMKGDFFTTAFYITKTLPEFVCIKIF